MNLQTTGWNALLASQPIDPLNAIANCSLGATAGAYKRSTTFLQAAWGANAVAFTGVAGLISLNTTDASTVAWASQWVTQTKMADAAASINSSISKVAFVKAGPYWNNQLEIGFGGINYTDVQLSFRDNLGTTGAFAGSASGAVPVFSFAGNHTGTELLSMTIPNPGTYSLVLVMNNAGTYSTFEMEIVAI
jgi:hypothetical protein